MLVAITARKAIAQRESHLTKKRGAGAIRGESALDALSDQPGIMEVTETSPTPELQAMMAEECEQRLGELEDVNLRIVALCKLEGFNNDEIAAVFGTTSRTVERWLRNIRAAWEQRP